MASAEYAVDGNYAQPQTNGPARWEYPFRKNGDNITAGFDQEYWQLITTFTPRPFKVQHPDYPGFYLIGESEPIDIGAGIYKFSRSWSRVPQQQIVPGSRFVTKPDLPGEFPQVSGNSLIIQPDPNVPRWVFYTQKAVTGDSGVPTGNSPTGGTYTVTIGASTTGAIAHNASAATLQSALNALASVSARGTVTVTGSYTAGFHIVQNAYSAATINTASLTGSGAYTAALVSSVVSSAVNFVINIQPNSNAFTGGTLTVTIFGQTSAAIAYNATAATVQAAIAALSNTSGCTVNVISRWGGAANSATSIHDPLATGIGFTIQVLPPAISVSGASLTPTGSAATVSTGSVFYGSGAYSTNLAFTGINLGTRTLMSVAHGISALDGIVLTQGANYRTIAAGAYSVTADTIILTSASGLAFSTPTTITFAGASTGNAYTGGSKLTRVKRVTDYYLPGITTGINTIDDIPLPDYEGDSASLLEAIFDGDTDINYEVGELEFYRDGPIVQRTRTTLDASQL